MPPKRKKGVKFGRITRKKQTKTKKKVKLEVVDYLNDDVNTVQICSICQDPCEVTDSEGAPSCSKCKRLIVISKVKSSSPIKCKQCTKVFKFKTSYIKHLKNEHSKTLGSVSCDQCHVSCPNKKVLMEHIETSHNRKEFECPQCLKKFVRHAHVLRHMAQSGCDGTEVSIFPCEICDAKFTRKDNLIVHLRYQHILSSAYACKHCEYRSKNFSKLIKHWQEAHLFPLKFECDICGKTTSSRTSMAKHLEIHGEKKYFCDTAVQIVKAGLKHQQLRLRLIPMRRHKRTEEEEAEVLENYESDECGYSTFTAEVLKRHTLTHVEHKPHKCEICGASFIQRIQLQRHLERHAGNVCPTCGKSFNSKSKLIIHERTHLGLNRLLCPFEDCVYSKKEFTNEASLDTHVAAHLKVKKYHCEVCNKGYHAEVNMRRHMITHRLDRPRRCMYCVAARAYIRGEQLVRHVRKHHAEIFLSHLAHVRRVLGTSPDVDRVKKSETDSILTMLDAESERILDGYGGTDVLYGGVTATDPLASQHPKSEGSPLMSEDELVENLKKLLSQLIDKETLECFGWPEETVDTVLEKVISQVGGRAADRARWTRVQCLRENTKHLFLYAVEDKNIARMLDTHTIDQVVKHILAQVTE